MTTPNFEVKVDVHGRHISSLQPSSTIELAVSGTTAGASLQGNIRTLESRHVAVRLSSNVDVYVVFSSNADKDAADSSGMLFIKGTEQFTMPEGTSYIAAIAEDGSSTGKFSATIMV